MMDFTYIDNKYFFEHDEQGCLIHYDNMTSEVVEAMDQGRAWTLLDVDGVLYVENGLSYVNRVSHFISERPCYEKVIVKFED